MDDYKRPLPFLSRREKRDAIILSAVCFLGWTAAFALAIAELSR
jgi:hypothetical protein